MTVTKKTYQNNPMPLIRHVRAWNDTPIPLRPKGSTDIDIARGVQWRLVIAMSAWECVARQCWPGKSHHECYDCAEVALEAPIPPPASRSMARWLDHAVPEVSIDDYFAMRSSGRTAITRWLGGEEITEHVEAMQLAWALRNATAHGYLSAAKVTEWGLRPALDALTDHVCRVVEAATPGT